MSNYKVFWNTLPDDCRLAGVLVHLEAGAPEGRSGQAEALGLELACEPLGIGSGGFTPQMGAAHLALVGEDHFDTSGQILADDDGRVGLGP